MAWVLVFFKENGTSPILIFLNERRISWVCQTLKSVFLIWIARWTSQLPWAFLWEGAEWVLCAWELSFFQWILHLPNKYFPHPACKLWWQFIISIRNGHCYLWQCLWCMITPISVLMGVKAAEFNKSRRWWNKPVVAVLLQVCNGVLTNTGSSSFVLAAAPSLKTQKWSMYWAHCPEELGRSKCLIVYVLALRALFTASYDHEISHFPRHIFSPILRALLFYWTVLIRFLSLILNCSI